MKTFTEFVRDNLNEKPQKVVKSGWTVLKLDDGTTLISSMELIDKNSVQISIKDGINKTYKLSKGKTFLDQVEEIIGQKLDIKDTKTKEFLNLYDCGCQN